MERSPIVIKTTVNCDKENRSGASRACLQKEYCKGFLFFVVGCEVFVPPAFKESKLNSKIPLCYPEKLNVTGGWLDYRSNISE